MSEIRLSDTLRKAIGAGTVPYALCGFWSGGVISITAEDSGIPGVFFQVTDVSSFQDSDLMSVHGLTLKKRLIAVNEVNVHGVVFYANSEEYLDPFLSLADYIFKKLAYTEAGSGGWLEVMGVMELWAEFWRRAGTRPQREAVLGLIGELVAMTDLLNVEKLSQEHWDGPRGGNHDFRTDSNSLEVKTCGTKTGPLSHKISSFRQLEPPLQGKLYVYSLRIELGRNLSRDFQSQIDAVRRIRTFCNSEAQAQIDMSLEIAGLSDGIPKQFSSFNVLESHLFEIDENFPKLTSQNLADGIVDVSYTIDLTNLKSKDQMITGKKFDLFTLGWS